MKNLTPQARSRDEIPRYARNDSGVRGNDIVFATVSFMEEMSEGRRGPASPLSPSERGANERSEVSGVCPGQGGATPSPAHLPLDGRGLG